MSIRHHPSDALLVDYASGAMGPAQSLVIASHVHACAHCRERVAAAESVGGALLEEIRPAAMAEDALALALARIERPEPELAPPSAPVAPQPPDWIAVPAEVREAARRKKWVAPGVWVAPVMTNRAGEPLSYLLRVGKGMKMPEHTHSGCELTLILKGSFRDGDEVFAAGDVAEADDDVEHSPHIAGDGECICLVACDNPLIVRGMIARVVQGLAGI
jgi:putative transcriptional regulator